MDLHDLMREFLKIEGAHVGKGYLHPDDPQPQLKEITEYFINKYPFVQRDQGYLDFLRMYAGAYIEQPPSNEEYPRFTWRVNINGFFFDNMRFAFEDETTIDDHLNQDGYLTFCISMFDDEMTALASKPASISYLFNHNIAGVYQRVLFLRSGLRDASYEPYCPDFLTWLAQFMENEGITF